MALVVNTVWGYCCNFTIQFICWELLTLTFDCLTYITLCEVNLPTKSEGLVIVCWPFDHFTPEVFVYGSSWAQYYCRIWRWFNKPLIGAFLAELPILVTWHWLFWPCALEYLLLAPCDNILVSSLKVWFVVVYLLHIFCPSPLISTVTQLTCDMGNLFSFVFLQLSVRRQPLDRQMACSV